MRPIALLATFVLALSTVALSPVPERWMPTDVGIPDHQWTGNRVVWNRRPLRQEWRDFQLDAPPAWVVAHPTRPRDRWLLADQDGTVSEFHRGTLIELAQLGPGDPPAVTRGDGGALRVGSRTDQDMRHEDSLPHGRWVSRGTLGARLAGPTDGYAHGVLGDEIEASALQLRADDGSSPRAELDVEQVIEGISAIAADLAENGPFGFVVTVSDAKDGARLRAYDEEGEVLAESDAIGQGFRWLHQIGVGPTGPQGEVEVIAVRTPHIGGVVEAYRLDGDRFERVATIEGYRSHVIGSPNLDMALLADTDADGRLEVIVPTQAMTELAILERTGRGFAEVARLPLEGQLATNVAAAVDGEGRLSLAAATEDGRLRIFR